MKLNCTFDLALSFIYFEAYLLFNVGPKSYNAQRNSLFLGQILGGHSSAPTAYTEKKTPDFAMGGPPIYKSVEIFSVYTVGEKIKNTYETQKIYISVELPFFRAPKMEWFWYEGHRHVLDQVLWRPYIKCTFFVWSYYSCSLGGSVFSQNPQGGSV